MESEQFASLGDRIIFEVFDNNNQNPQQEKQSEVEIARRHNFILFDEIIESSPAQSRTVVFDPENIEEDRVLLKSILSNGIVTDIIVRELEQDGQEYDPFHPKKQGERTFALVAGHRRVAAGRAAGLAGAHARITRPSDDHNLITLAENTGRKELTTYEKALAYKSLQERRELSENRTADLVGVSQATINRYFNALKSPQVLREMWRDGKIGDLPIIILKRHWQEIEQLENPELIGKLHGLSQSEAHSLRDQIGSGTPLEIALSARQQIAGTRSPLNSTKQPPHNPAKQSKQSRAPTPKDDSETRLINDEALMTAIKDVFPRISKNKFESIMGYTAIQDQ